MQPSRKWLIVAASGVAAGLTVGAVRGLQTQEKPRVPADVASKSVLPAKAASAAPDQNRIPEQSLAKTKKQAAAEFQLSNQMPVGWVAEQRTPSVDREVQIYFRVPDHPGIKPGIHFHPFSAPVLFWGQEVRLWLGEIANAKEAQRIREGFLNYRNRPEMTQRVIGNRAALCWAADFTRNGEPWVENLAHVFSPSGTALFFAQAPASEIEDVQASFNIIIETSSLPTLAVSEGAGAAH